jgi:hypothetical protein
VDRTSDRPSGPDNEPPIPFGRRAWQFVPSIELIACEQLRSFRLRADGDEDVGESLADELLLGGADELLCCDVDPTEPNNPVRTDEDEQI